MNAVTEPLVSIIVPIYNVEKYLDQCVASLIQQTHHNIEILLIDDGSPDNAPAICDAWQHKDERVHVLHKTNSGVSASRNAGLHAAKGEYVCFVDGDDWVEPDFVEYMLELQAKRNADIVASLCCFTSTDFHQRTQDEVSTINPQEAMELFFYPTIELGAWNKLYRRSFLTANNLEFITDFCAGEGLQFITLAASKANCVTVGQKRFITIARITRPVPQPSLTLNDRVLEPLPQCNIFVNTLIFLIQKFARLITGVCGVPTVIACAKLSLLIRNMCIVTYCARAFIIGGVSPYL